MQDAMVRACDEKRRGVRRKEGDGYRSAKKQEEDRRRGGRTVKDDLRGCVDPT